MINLYLGTFEFTLWATLTRMISASALATIVYRLCFASRPGLALLANLSIPSAVPVVVAQVRRSLARRAFLPALAAVALFVLSLTAVIADLALSTRFAVLRSDRETQVAWLRASDLAGARKLIPTSQMGRALPRDQVLGAMQALVQDDLRGNGSDPTLPPPNVWPRTSGTLDEAEVMATVLRPSLCSAGPGAGAGAGEVKPLTPLDLSYMLGPGYTIQSNYDEYSARRAGSFGFQQAVVALQVESNSSVTSFRGFRTPQVGFPLPLTYATDSPGQAQRAASAEQAAANQRKPVFGAIVVDKTLSVYKMECGRTPDEVAAWLAAKLATPPAQQLSFEGNARTGAAPDHGPVMYREAVEFSKLLGLSLTGTSRSMFIHSTPDLLKKGAFDLLTFGSEVSGAAGFKRTSLATAIDFFGNGTAGPGSGSEALDWATGISAVSQTCAPVAKSPAVFVKSNTTAAASAATLARTNPYAALVALSSDNQKHLSPQQCTLTARGLTAPPVSPSGTRPGTPRDYPIMTDLSGAQVCKMRVQTFELREDAAAAATAANDDFAFIRDMTADMVGAFRVETQATPLQLNCLPGDATAEAPPAYFGALLSRVRRAVTESLAGGNVARGGTARVTGDGWAIAPLSSANTGGWLATSDLSAAAVADPAGPAMYSITAVRVELWELLLSVAAVLGVVALAVVLRWDSMPSIALAAVYEYAYFQQAQGGTEEKPGEAPPGAGRAAVAQGIPSIDVMQTTKLALVELPTAPEPTLVVRLVPTAEDGNPYLPLDEGGDAARRGTIVATGYRFSDLEAEARRRDPAGARGLSADAVVAV
ncbi:hypothetical protein H9P43_000195 [Blastocladiella emersonii ATCC 22665]|nr:hypothetical protein H9P43_000195 [Blastocladiella emersonii ATCC 22665]